MSGLRRHEVGLTAEQQKLYDSEPWLPEAAAKSAIEFDGVDAPHADVLEVATRAAREAARTWCADPAHGPYEAWAFFTVRWAILCKYEPEERKRSVAFAVDEQGCRWSSRFRRDKQVTLGDPAKTQMELDAILGGACADMQGSVARVADDPLASVADREDAMAVKRAMEEALAPLTPEQRAWLALKREDDATVKRYAAEHGLSYKPLLKEIRRLEQRVGATLRRLGVTAQARWREDLAGSLLVAPSNQQGKAER